MNNTGFAYQLGGYVYDNVYQSLFSESTGMGNSGANFHRDVYKTWTPENPNAEMPILASSGLNQYLTSDMFLISANYLSLENFGVSYDLSNPQELMSLAITCSCFLSVKDWIQE